MTTPQLKLALVRAICETNDELLLRTVAHVLWDELETIEVVTRLHAEEEPKVALEQIQGADTGLMKLREPSVEYRSSSEPLRRPLNEVDDDAITGVRPDGTPVTPASAVTGCDAGVAEVLAGGASVGRRYSHEYKLAMMPTLSFDSRAQLSPEVIQQLIAKAGSPLTAKRVADALTQKAMALDSVGSALMMFYTPPVTGYEYRSLSHES